MKKTIRNYNPIIKINALINLTQVRVMVIPLVLAVLISLIPLFWELDLMVQRQLSTTKNLVPPASEIVVITIDDEDNRLYGKKIGVSMFGPQASRWRTIHAQALNNLSSLDKVPKSVGYDIIFYTQQTAYDEELTQAFQKAAERNINLVLGVRDKALNTKHWAYWLYKMGSVQLGSVFANAYSDNMIKSYPFKARLDITGELEKSVEIPSLATALFFRNPDLSMVDEEKTVKLVKSPFIQFNYRDILEQERFDQIKQRLAGKIILIGAEHPGDIIRFPFIPIGQPKLDKDTTFGVFYHANALNYMFFKENLSEITGLGKVFLIFLLSSIAIGLNLIFGKFNLRYRVPLILALIVLMNSAALRSDYLLPWVSMNFVGLLAVLVSLFPELWLKIWRGRLNNVSKNYNYMGKELFQNASETLAKPCMNLSQLSDYIHTLSKIFIEAKGHTWFEEIDFKILDALNVLNPEYQLSKKRPDCIGRADYLTSEFVGTRIRRIRNFLAHANLSPHIVEMALDSILYYSGKTDYLALNAADIYKTQL
ncbi:CHASE2 domain-containing protein, partial [bacterium]|nr:CHASE2 domain-containing protein [bacterium]